MEYLPQGLSLQRGSRGAELCDQSLIRVSEAGRVPPGWGHWEGTQPGEETGDSGPGWVGGARVPGDTGLEHGVPVPRPSGSGWHLLAPGQERLHGGWCPSSCLLSLSNRALAPLCREPDSVPRPREGSAL